MKDLRFVIALCHAAALTSAVASEVKPSRDAAWTPEQTLRSIELDGPYEAQLVAAEPLVRDPVEMCWDARGACYVADMLDYPLGGPDGKPLSRVQRLFDENGDGVYDRAVTFADQLDHVQGLLPHRDGLVITTRTQILFLRDKDGDGVADERVPLIAGFNPSFSQLQVSSPRRGLDGEIYFNNGLDSKEIYPVAEGEGKMNVARDNFRWNPRTGKIHPSSGFGQYGGGFDDWGRHFFSANRSPVMFAVMPREAAAGGRTQYWENIVPSGAASRVYPIQITHTTSDAHSGTNTSACGLAVYRGDLMPELRGEIFVCDPTGQLVSRFHQPKPNGASLVSDRVGNLTEFFRSRDEWCRPVNLTTGPDGALYVCDIYRQYIDHARFFPDEFVKTHDMRSGEGQGRIWRIVPKGTTPGALRAIGVAPAGTRELVAWLGHENAWQRETAQRLLLEQADQLDAAKRVLDELRLFAAEDLSPLAKLHYLWTFAGVQGAAPDEVKAAHAGDDWLSVLKGKWGAELAENVILLASRFPGGFQGERASFIKQACKQGNTRARMLWLATAESAADGIDGCLERPADLEDPWFQSAMIGRFKGHTGEIAAKLAGGDFSRESSAPKITLFRSLAAAAAAGNSAPDFRRLVGALEREPGKLLWWKPAILQGLAEGLPKSDGSVAGKSLVDLTKGSREGMEPAQREIPGLLGQLDQVVFDPGAPLELRLASLPLIGQRPPEEGGALLVKLLGSDQPPAVSTLAFATLRQFGAVKIAPLLYGVLASSGPAIRKEIVSTLAGDPRTRVDLLQKMERGEVPKSLLDAEARWSILQAKDEPVKTLAGKLFQRPSEDRAKVVAEYLPSTRAKGDAMKGQEIFTNVCGACHSFKGHGIAVGPDISDVRAREKDALLNDILDPNRMIEARWSANKVVLKDGRTLLGLMDSEGEKEITLRMPGGLKESIRRDQIQTFEALETSLMPVGLEGGITTSQMADLLAFLRGE